MVIAVHLLKYYFVDQQLDPEYLNHDAYYVSVQALNFCLAYTLTLCSAQLTR